MTGLGFYSMSEERRITTTLRSHTTEQLVALRDKLRRDDRTTSLLFEAVLVELERRGWPA